MVSRIGGYGLLACSVVLLSACPGSHPTDNPVGLSVAGTSPPNGASDVSLDADISASLSQDVDPASVSSASLVLQGSGGPVAGTVALRSSTIFFTPAASLSPGTSYTVVLAGSVHGVDGASLGNSFRWSFTTAASGLPSFSLPLQAGQRWHYARNDTTNIVAASTGVTTLRFTGERYAWVAEQLDWQGRAASRLVVYDYNSTPSSGDPAFTVEEIYLAQGNSELWRWAGLGGTSGEWRQVLAQARSIANGAFVFNQGPTKGKDLVIAGSSTVVPAGTFTTLSAQHVAAEHSQYATATWDEYRREEFATGVGLVRSRWDYSYDDKDPAAADISQHGSIALLDAQSASPVFRAEAEPNDTATTAVAAALPRFVVEGMTRISDRGSAIMDRAVQCPLNVVCVNPNTNGQPILQDWYRLDLTATTTITIELAYQTYDESASKFNDLDLYEFQAVAGGGLKYIGSSLRPAGETETVQRTFAAGTYYFAVQAWDTPGNAVRYWLSIR